MSKKVRISPSLIFFVVLYVLFVFLLAIARYKSFISFEGPCEALRNNLIFNNTHGQFFHTFRPQGIEHVELIEFLFWPIYLLFPSMQTLYFIQTLFLGLTAIPLYLLGKEVNKSDKVGFWLALSFLVWAPLYNLNFSYFTWLLVLPFFLVLNFYFFYKKKYFLFVVTAILSLLVREDISLYYIIFAFYTFLKNRKIDKWGITSFVFGLMWFYLCRIFILFAFDTVMLTERFYPARRLSYIISGIFSRIWGHLHIFLKLFLPINFIGFFSLEMLLIIPSVMLLLLDKESQSLRIYNIHHLTFIIPIIFIAVIFAFNKLTARFNDKKKQYLARLFFIFTCLTLFLPNMLGSFHTENNYLPDSRFFKINNILAPKFFKSYNKNNDKWQILKLVPANVSVACTGDFLPALSNRTNIYEYPPDDSGLVNIAFFNVQPDYYVLNLEKVFFGAGHNNSDSYPVEFLKKDIGYLLKHGYRIITQNNSCYLLKKD